MLPLIGRRTPVPRRDGAEEGLPSSQDNRLTVPRPLRREVPPHPLQDPECVPWPSPYSGGLGSSLAARRRSPMTTPQASLSLRTGQLLHPASHPTSRRRTGASLPGTLASPRTGLPPAGCPELVERLRHDDLLVIFAPALLGAPEHSVLGAPVPAVWAAAGEGADDRHLGAGATTLTCSVRRTVTERPLFPWR